jgi:hypothetical protein
LLDTHDNNDRAGAGAGVLKLAGDLLADAKDWPNVKGAVMNTTLPASLDTGGTPRRFPGRLGGGADRLARQTPNRGVGWATDRGRAGVASRRRPS